MPEGRFVNKRMSDNEQLGRVSWQADLLFTKCIPHLDVAGRITGNPVLLKSKVLPLRAEVSAEVIPGLIEELERAVGHEGDPLVRAYTVNGQAVLEFPGFVRQQKGLKPDREATSQLPSRPKGPDTIGSKGKRRRSRSGFTPEQVLTGSGLGPGKCKDELREGELSEEKLAAGAANGAAAGNWVADYAVLFEQIGVFEPGRVGRACQKVRAKYGPERTREMLQAFVAYAPHLDRQGEVDPRIDNPQFTTPEQFAGTAARWYARTEPIGPLSEPSPRERGPPTVNHPAASTAVTADVRAGVSPEVRRSHDATAPSR